MPTSRLDNNLVVITGGDPSGVGPEVILKALSEKDLLKKITPLVIGDYNIFQKTAKTINLDIPLLKPSRSTKIFKKRDTINFIDLQNVNPAQFKFGRKDARYGMASIEYLKTGTSIVMQLKGVPLVTAPISKESINKAGFALGGHTEFLSKYTGKKNVTMMLLGGNLRVSLVTRHIALAQVSKKLTRKKIIETAKNTYFALKKYIGIKNPKIGITALNPHGGEGGALGKEEKNIILPAIASLQRKIKGLRGPMPAEVLFRQAYKKEIDAVVSMYHDQGLVPLKMVYFDKGVNFTIGLPFIRTSPDHGTGFDIAGKNKANPRSMTEAIILASRFSKKL